MNEYRFCLAPGYCLFNGIAVLRQRGASVDFLLEYSAFDVMEKRRRLLRTLFLRFVEFAHNQRDCPVELFCEPRIRFFYGSAGMVRRIVRRELDLRGMLLKLGFTEPQLMRLEAVGAGSGGIVLVCGSHSDRHGIAQKIAALLCCQRKSPFLEPAVLDICDRRSFLLALKGAFSGRLAVAVFPDDGLGDALRHLQSLLIPLDLCKRFFSAAVTVERNFFEGREHFMADVAVPLRRFLSLTDVPEEEEALDACLDHCTNYQRVLAESLGALVLDRRGADTESASPEGSGSACGDEKRVERPAVRKPAKAEKNRVINGSELWKNKNQKGASLPSAM